MSGAFDVLTALAQPGPRADAIATVICCLVTEGALLEELEERAVTDAGAMRTIFVPQAVWFDRLAKAIATGAIDRLPPAHISERILTTPPPAADVEQGRVA